jgi:hypothetical protein
MLLLYPVTCLPIRSNRPEIENAFQIAGLRKGESRIFPLPLSPLPSRPPMIQTWHAMRAHCEYIPYEIPWSGIRDNPEEPALAPVGPI